MRAIRRILLSSMLITTVFAASLSFVIWHNVRAQNTSPASKDDSSPVPHPVLVELFTSEGCSSCPPADASLEKMDAHPLAGAQLIVMREHVTYWDHDGWKDPNSSSYLTDRQSAYEDALSIRTPYTPQIIVDGTSVLRMDAAQGTNSILRKAAGSMKLPVHLESLSIARGTPSALRARITVDSDADNPDADVFVAVALNRVESQVLHGENGGRHLVHVSVVQQLTKVGKLEMGKSFDHEIQIKLKPGEDPMNLRIIVFVQEPGPGRVLGATWRKVAS